MSDTDCNCGEHHCTLCWGDDPGPIYVDGLLCDCVWCRTADTRALGRQRTALLNDKADRAEAQIEIIEAKIAEQRRELSKLRVHVALWRVGVEASEVASARVQGAKLTQIKLHDGSEIDVPADLTALWRVTPRPAELSVPTVKPSSPSYVVVRLYEGAIVRATSRVFDSPETAASYADTVAGGAVIAVG